MNRYTGAAPILLTVLLAGLAAASATAQEFPSKPIRMVVGYPPGGGVDSVARIASEAMGNVLRNPVLIDNKPGASTTIAAEIVAKSPPDGHTLFAMQPFTYGPDKVFVKTLNYDGPRAFTPITQWTFSPLILTVSNNLEVTTVQQMVAVLRKSPDKYFYATIGAGGIAHSAALLFLELTKTSMVHVPFKGAPEGMLALGRGDVHMNFVSATAAAPLVSAGRARMLGVTSEKRSRLMPDLPSLAESGVTGYDITVSIGMAGPAGMQAPVVKKLFDSSLQGLKAPEVADRLAKQNFEVAPSASPEQYRALLIREGEKQARLARQSGVVPE